MADSVNILVRGQSNAEYFVEFGGAARLEQALESRLAGVDVNIVAHYKDPYYNNTIYSNTAFLYWDTNGEQRGLLAHLNSRPDAVLAAPTVTLWMHNEFDGLALGVTTGDWVSEVRTDAALVRDALGQDAETTPYVFTYVPYVWQDDASAAAIRQGMREFAADPGFHAEFAEDAMAGLAMDGPGDPTGQHMSGVDAQLVADRLADTMAPLVAGLAGAEPPPDAEPAPTPARTVLGTGPDRLVVRLSQDEWQGDALYQVIVDGKPLGDPIAASARHGEGPPDALILRGRWTDAPHTVGIEFLNDAWGGTPETDRNLHIDSLTLNGARLRGAAELQTEGVAEFDVGIPPAFVPVGRGRGQGPDTLTLEISQDAWRGKAEYTVSVDGEQVGAPLRAFARRVDGTHDTVTLRGDWDDGPHVVTVDFLNDASGSTPLADRNLHVESITWQGVEQLGVPATLYSTGAMDFAFG